MQRFKLLYVFSLVIGSLLCGSQAWSKEPMELKVDHVMFPVYMNDTLLEFVEHDWKNRDMGRVFTQPPNNSFKGLYLSSKNFYVEYLSNVNTQPYWSSAVYLVVPTEYWDAFKNPVLRTDNFLIPFFGSGYQLLSPSYPNLNSIVSKDESYNGLTILISKALEQELLKIGGEQWTLPKDGSMRVHEGLHHLHDIAVIDQNNKIVAPLLEANPVLRDYF